MRIKLMQCLFAKGSSSSMCSCYRWLERGTIIQSQQCSEPQLEASWAVGHMVRAIQQSSNSTKLEKRADVPLTGLALRGETNGEEAIHQGSPPDSWDNRASPKAQTSKGISIWLKIRNVSSFFPDFKWFYLTVWHNSTDSSHQECCKGSATTDLLRRLMYCGKRLVPWWPPCFVALHIMELEKSAAQARACIEVPPRQLRSLEEGKQADGNDWNRRIWWFPSEGLPECVRRIFSSFLQMAM